MKNIRLYKGLKGNVFFNSSGELFLKKKFVVLNKSFDGYLFIFNKNSKNLKILWLFPNYFNIFLVQGSLVLRPKSPWSRQKLLPFYKNFYRGMYFFHGFCEDTLHFVGVGYKIRFYRRRRKLKLFLWVGYCTWQILRFRPRTIRKFSHESFRLLGLKLFSQNFIYFKKIFLMIKNIRPSEPYKGKGIRFLDEKVRRKPGKTGRI